MPADASSSVEADDTVSTISPIIVSNSTGDAVDPLAALDLFLGIPGRGLVGGLLGDQRLLEHLQCIGHLADLGRFPAMRHIGGEVALPQRLHRRHDRVDAARNVAYQIEADTNAHHASGGDDDRQQHEGGAVLRLCRGSGRIGALVVQFNVLVQDGVRLLPDRQILRLIELLRLGRIFADAAARQRDHFLHAGLVFGPLLDPIIVQGAFFRRVDDLLIVLADLQDRLGRRIQPLFGSRLAFGRQFQEMRTQNAAIAEQLHLELAEQTDAGQPIRSELGGAGVDRSQRHHRQQADASHGQEEKGDDGCDLGTDGEFGEHGATFLTIDMRRR